MRIDELPAALEALKSAVETLAELVPAIEAEHENRVARHNALTDGLTQIEAKVTEARESVAREVAKRTEAVAAAEADKNRRIAEIAQERHQAEADHKAALDAMSTKESVLTTDLGTLKGAILNETDRLKSIRAEIEAIKAKF